MSLSKFDLVFEEWKASLRNKDKKREAVSGNFDDLFCDLKSAGALFDEAYVFVSKAAKAHYPPAALVKNIWKNQKSHPKFVGLTEKDFVESWNSEIADKAMSAFFSVFPRPKEQDESSDDPKINGSDKISTKEYRLLREHANQFRPLDLSSLPDPYEDVALLSEEDLLNFIRGKNE